VREATIELMKTLGPEQLTTAKIAERAGVGIGSLYRYYPNKEAIFTDIYEQTLDDLNLYLSAGQRENSSSGQLEDLIREGMELTVAMHRELLDMHAAFFVTFQRNFNFVDRRGPDGKASWDSWVQQWLIDVMTNNAQRLKVTDLPGTARLLIDMTYGTLQRIIETRPQALYDPALAEQLAELICRYLIAPEMATNSKIS
jgi:AcrR family transcriptional regulator